MILIWTSLLLATLVSIGRPIKNPSNSEASYSTSASPEITGDASLCIVIGGVIGTYSAGGLPGDVYEWTITKSTGE
ncbi:hypothetical protein, partial [Algoriphagus sp.]